MRARLEEDLIFDPQQGSGGKAPPRQSTLAPGAFPVKPKLVVSWSTRAACLVVACAAKATDPRL